MDRAIAFDLSADRGVVPTQSPGNLSQSKLGHLQMADDMSLLGCKMNVGHDGLLSGVWVVRTSNTTRNPIMSCFSANPQVVHL
jgi:hypothetical protein